MDQIQSLIDKIGVENLKIGGGVVVGLIILRMVMNMMKRKPAPGGSPATCTCGWSGRTSRYRPQCPKCGKEPKFDQERAAPGR